MEEEKGTQGLVGSRQTALFVTCVTGVLAAMSVRGIFVHHSQQSRWPLPLDYLLPSWAVLAANVAFYVYLVWLGIWFCMTLYRVVQGKERVLVAGWLSSILLGRAKLFVAASVADVIQWLRVLAMLAAFVAALGILRKFQKTPDTQS